MTLGEFIESCPEGIRLGQWFIVCYWKGEATDQSRELFQLDGEAAKWYIFGVITRWQWDIFNMPEFNKETS